MVKAISTKLLDDGRRKSSLKGGALRRANQALAAPPDLPTCSVVKVRVSIPLSGAGQRRKIILRDDEEWNGVAWSHIFDATRFYYLVGMTS